MNITVNNIDSLLRVEIVKQAGIVDINDNPSGVFLVWSDSSNKKMFDKQTNIITKAIKKKIPIIIFDKYQKMDGDEISFLVKEGVFLWEPAVNDRMFFSFQPVWGRLKLDLQDIEWDFDEVRPVDLVYTTSLSKKLPTFKNYFEPIAEIGEFNVAYFDSVCNQNINKKVADMGVDIFVGAESTKAKMTMLLGTEQDYRVGYLDPKLFEYLEAGIVPMLPTEHRWFHSVFQDLTVKDECQMEYFLRTVDTIGFGSVYEIYHNLNTYLPESNVENVAQRILSYFK